MVTSLRLTSRATLSAGRVRGSPRPPPPQVCHSRRSLNHDQSWSDDRLMVGMCSPNLNFHMITLRRQEDLLKRPVLLQTMESFLAPTTRFATPDAPGHGEPSIVVQAEFSCGKESVQCLLRIATAMESSSTTIGHCFIDLKPDWEVQLDGLSRHALNGWEEAMAIRSITLRSCGDAPKGDLVELVPLAARFEAGVEEVRAIAEAGGGHEGRVLLAEEGLHDVHAAAEEVSATAD